AKATLRSGGVRSRSKTAVKTFGTYFGLEAEVGPEGYGEFRGYYQEMLKEDLLGSHPLCGELAQIIAAPRDSRTARCLGPVVGFLPVETLPSGVRERLGFESTPKTMLAMRALRSSAPVLFPRLPDRIRRFPEAVERLQRERGVG
ncbi:MAG: oxygenase MpaB family protein, partial [Verrucomicrobiota bacterium]